LAFIGDARLVIHNIAFDIGFLNAELERAGQRPLERDRLVDTLLLARRKFPGGSNRLDDLCVRYSIDNSRRTKHGALLDAELLAEVYLELIEARQAQLGLAVIAVSTAGPAAGAVRPRATPLAHAISALERAAHRAFVATLGSHAIWKDYLDPPETETAGNSAQSG
jgi:DNA polymerase III subunit epsilon